MTSTEFFAMLGMTGVVLGPYLFYEAKGLPMKGFGTAITIGSLIVLFHYALTFLTFHPFAPPSLRSLVLCLPFAVLSGLIIRH
jgi:hypothetical protein